MRRGKVKWEGKVDKAKYLAGYTVVATKSLHLVEAPGWSWLSTYMLGHQHIPTYEHLSGRAVAR